MPDRKKIDDKIRRKENEIQSLEDKLKAAKVYIQALKDVVKMLEQDDDPTSSAEATLRQGSAVAQARDVILKSAAPVHIDEILTSLGKDVTREAKASLTSSLAAYVRRGDIFTRPAPNTFGLIELGHESENFEVDDEPPTGFGAPPAVEVERDEVPF